jgi:hypothetical protein
MKATRAMVTAAFGGLSRLSHRKRWPVWVGVACLAFLSAGQASGAVISGPLIADLENPVAYTIEEVNEAGGIIVDDKLFADFTVVSTDSVGASSPGPEAIEVTGVVIAGEVGLKFNGGWSALKDMIADSTITFRVSVQEPERSDGWVVFDNTLWMTAFGADGGGFISISENVYTVDPREAQAPEPVANKLVFFQDDVNKKLSDHVEFPPGYADVWVVKNVIVNGGEAVGDAAHLSEFYNTFSQVPEPATLGLLAVGGAAALLSRRRRRG